MGKIFNDISDAYINDEELAKLEFHISAVGYLEEGLSCITEVLTKENNQNKDKIVKESEVYDSEKEKKKRKVWREAQVVKQLATGRWGESFSMSVVAGSESFTWSAPPASTFAVARSESFAPSTPSTFASPAPISVVLVSTSSTLSAPSVSAPPVSASTMPLFGFFTLPTPSASAHFTFASTISVSGSSAAFLFFAFAFSAFASAVPVSRFFATSATLTSIHSTSTSVVLVFRFSALFAPSTFGFAFAMSVFSAFSTLAIPLSPYRPTLGRRRLIVLDRRKIGATSKELTPVYTCQLPSNKHPSLLLFLSTCISKKQPFDKAFNINSWSLAKDYTRKEVDLSFAGCQGPSAVKANRA